MWLSSRHLFRTFIFNPRQLATLRFGNCFSLRRASFSSAPSLRNSFLSPEFIFVCALHASNISHSPAFNQSFFFCFFSEIHFRLRPSHPKHFVWPCHQQFFLLPFLSGIQFGLRPLRLKPSLGPLCSHSSFLSFSPSD